MEDLMNLLGYNLFFRALLFDTVLYPFLKINALYDNFSF